MENSEKVETKNSDEHRSLIKKEKIKNWIKNPYNLTFLIIFILIIFIRGYYFIQTQNQPLWWDESEYMTAAKSFAGIGDFKLPGSRFPGFSLIASIFFLLSINNEPVLRFFLAFIPSIIAILLVYLCINEMFKDRRIALISLAIFGVLWEHLFYSNRFHTENFGLIFQALAIFIVFRVYLKKENFGFIKPKFVFLWIILFALLSGFFRPGNLIFIPPLILFLMVVHKSKFFNKYTYFIWTILTLGALYLLLFLPKNIPRSGLLAYMNPQNPLAWSNLIVFKGFYESLNPVIPPVLFYAFIVGLIITLWELYLYWDSLKKFKPDSEFLEIKSKIFNLISLVLIMIYFVFILRSYGSFEYRWFFPLIFSMLFFTSKGVIWVSDSISSLAGLKKFSIIIIIFICVIGIYTQIIHADMIIKAKLDSYSQVRDAAIWMKENTNEDDVILSRSLQTTYYSERKVHFFRGFNESQFLELVNDKHPKYMFESALEGSMAEWGLNPTEKMQKFLVPVNVWFLDKEKKQPIAIVYEIDYQKFNEIMNPQITSIKNQTLQLKVDASKNQSSDNKSKTNISK